MEAIESTRQQKVGRQIQRDLSDILIKECAELIRGTMVTVTSVKMSSDLGYAKIYLSIFPFDRHEQIMTTIESNNWRIRRSLGSRLRNQLRTVPELSFFLDDSLEYIDNISSLLKEEPTDENR